MSSLIVSWGSRRASWRRPAASSCLESTDVGGGGIDPQGVAQRPGLDQLVRHPGVAQALAHPGHHGAEGLLRHLLVLVRPEGIKEAIDRHREVPVDEESGQQGPGARAADFDRSALPQDLDRSEDANLQPSSRALPRAPPRCPGSTSAMGGTSDRCARSYFGPKRSFGGNRRRRQNPLRPGATPRNPGERRTGGACGRRPR